MTRPHLRPGRTRAVASLLTALLTATLVSGAVRIPALAESSAPAPAAASVGAALTLGDTPAGLADLDDRGSALPSARQRSVAHRLDAAVRWNSFGTPASILPSDGWLGNATSSNAVTAARSWLRANAAVFGLTGAQVADLTLVNNQQFAGSSARAVLLRQQFGDLAPALDSMVTVGVARGEIAYVSSSLVKTAATPPTATLTPLEGWLAAARNVGRDVSPAGITTEARAGWSRFDVPGFAQEQLSRLRSLALADGRVRPVYESNVVDVHGGSAFAYTVLVDAVTGDVLHRQNMVENSMAASSFSGEITPTACGPMHPFELTDGLTQQIVVTAAEAQSVNDIVIKLWGPGDQLLASGDLGTSPETLTYAPGGAIAQGIYHTQICPFDAPTVPLLPPYNYAGTVVTSDQSGTTATPAQPLPRWRYFPSNPSLDWSSTVVSGGSKVGCWAAESGCTLPTGALAQPWGPPWDFAYAGPTLTTVGDNADTHEAWASPDSPGGTAQAPVSPTREYTTRFTDAWNNSKCDPTQLHPTGNDIDAVVTNLFVAHNRMHDFAYGLGFTERNYNLQLDNLGRNPDPTRAGDPEVGNAQAGALTGGQPSYVGRDNANQIALQDGVPGITNQYLFQPIAGAFYSPCADGGLDMSIVGHEYTHAISNRMIGGPDEGITSEQGGAMGESWGDLTAAEYMFSHGYATGANPWAVGPYATGNKSVGIRDYPINANPLNYGDYGFDSTGVEVHADGEIWNGTMWEVRQALVKKYDARFPSTDKDLELRCAQGTEVKSPLPASRCPGDRRWIQLMFDAFLLQQGATSMLDARDAMLAADRMRFDGADQGVLWGAFAKRGMGIGASTPNADSGQPRPSFRSPRAANATVRFTSPVGGTVYVGRYQARVTPVGDTKPSTGFDGVVRFAPGTYAFVFQAPGHGLQRFRLTLRAGQTRTLKIPAPVNLASEAAGARVLGASAGSINPDSLIDDTEGTNWAGINDGTNVDAVHPWVVIDLAGGVRTVHRIQVSAMLRPAPASATDVPLAADPDSGSRFTALRRFAVEACVTSCAATNATWVRIFTSPGAAFPGLRPRPVAPNLIMRGFDVKDTKAAALRFVALENQCTGYAGYAGEQDDDPTNNTDCKTGSDRGQSVRAAEFEVF
jgi:extracellular elastinolytic metalloproteinase